MKHNIIVIYLNGKNMFYKKKSILKITHFKSFKLTTYISKILNLLNDILFKILTSYN